MTMYKVGTYFPNDSMSELICDNYTMILVMNRFGIELGFGEDSIGEVCQKSGVNVDTFLSIVNLLVVTSKKNVKIDYKNISIAAIVSYLHNSHAYFLEYRLPSIRQKLVDALDGNDDSISMLIVNYYDEYVTEVNKHMRYEEETVFPYITSMLGGTATAEYNIDMFSKHHDKVEERLSELKNIIIKYYTSKTTNELSSVLYDIFSCQRDLASHNDIEDYLLIPAMAEFETTKK